MTITLTREEAQQVLVVLTYHYKGRPEDYEVIYNLRARLAQSEPEQLGKIVPADEEQLKRIAKLVAPEPEPVACIVKGCENHKHQGRFVGDLCSPCHAFITRNEGKYSQAYRNAQREWQGLTDREIMDACSAVWASHPVEVGNVVQDLLKEKNT